MDIILALGGGGIKGIAHIGVLEGLENAGFRIRAIAGTSVGGLVGSVYAAGYHPKEILAIIQNINPNRLYARQASDGPSLLGYTGLADTLVEVLGEIQFSELTIPFACTAVDIRTTQEVYLSQGRVLDAVLATIAIPGVFPAKICGELELVDGGILDMDITARMLTEMRLEIDRPEVIIRPDVHAYGMFDMVDPEVLVAAGLRAAKEAVPEIRKALSWTNTALRVLRSSRQSIRQPDGVPVVMPSLAVGTSPCGDLSPGETLSQPSSVSSRLRERQP